MMGRDNILAEARAATESGDYRWAVQVLHHLVFADPSDTEAKNLQADAYEQLGYQQEVPQYRAIFLTAAKELREGVATEGQATTASQDTILAMPVDLLFDFAGVHIAGERAADVDIRINVTFLDSGGDWTMWVRHGVLNARQGHADGAQLTIAGPKAALAGILLQPANAKAVISRAGVKADGDLDVLDILASITDTFDAHFNISTP